MHNLVHICDMKQRYQRKLPLVFKSPAITLAVAGRFFSTKSVLCEVTIVMSGSGIPDQTSSQTNFDLTESDIEKLTQDLDVGQFSDR